MYMYVQYICIYILIEVYMYIYIVHTYICTIYIYYKYIYIYISKNIKMIRIGVIYFVYLTNPLYCKHGSQLHWERRTYIKFSFYPKATIILISQNRGFQLCWFLARTFKKEKWPVWLRKKPRFSTVKREGSRGYV